MPAATGATGASGVALGGDGSPVIGKITPGALASFLRRLPGAVGNWPEVLARLSLSSAGVKRGDITTRLRSGTTILSPPSRPAWWPVFEMFVEDVYHLSGLGDVRLEEGDVVLDLGAHIGAAALLFAERWPAASLVCIEPNPATFSYLEANLRANRTRATARNEAVGAADGTATLFGIDEASCEASTSMPRPGASREVPVVAFARLVGEAPGPVRVVKLDCEGAEHEVLAASGPELWADVEVVLLEYHRTEDPGSTWPATEARVRALGFETSWQMPFDWHPGLGMAGFRRPG